MSKYIAFDLGNVIFDIDYKEFWQVIAELEVNTDDMDHYLKLIERQEFCGIARMKDYFEEFFSQDEAETLANVWNDVIKENDYMTSFLKELKEQEFNIAFVSNIGIDEVFYAREKYPHIFELADVQHMSCEVGVAKPSLLYYQSFCIQNPKFANCVYVDDREENVQAGKRCDFKSVKFDLSNFVGKTPDLTEIRKALKERFLINLTY